MNQAPKLTTYRLDYLPLLLGLLMQKFNDNRLGSLLTRLSKDKRWESFEAVLFEHEVELYEICAVSLGDWVSAPLRSTTACGYHRPRGKGLMQYSHSKDQRTDMAQLKLMRVAVHPHGHWVATDVVAGQRADDGLYLTLAALIGEHLRVASRALFEERREKDERLVCRTSAASNGRADGSRDTRSDLA